MKTHSASLHRTWRLLLLVAGAALAAAPASAQVPVDQYGNPIQPIDESTGTAGARVETVPAEELMTPEELQGLVGPIALYPDDLLAIVLPASTYPLEIVQAARFLEDYENDNSLEPDESWDDSVVALLNYPEVLRMMNEDIDWTWRLGEAMVNQQADVIAAVESFRDRAYAAGNLKSDKYQTVTQNGDGVIEIEPVSEDIIYVPYYEPERVVVYQPRPAYYYYPRPYPVYYYPYPHGYNFYSNYFWGVTTAFTIGWTTHDLHVFHHSYFGHPYYGHTYYPYWWYRRPSITIYNSWYGERRTERTRDHYARGDVWRPRHTGGARPGFHRERLERFRDGRRETSASGYRNRPPATTGAGRTQISRSDAGNRSGSGARPLVRDDGDGRAALRNRARDDTAIRFREREGRPIAPLQNRERAVGNGNDNERRGVTTRRDTSQRPMVTQRSEQNEAARALPRRVTPSELRRRDTENRERVQQNTERHETAARTPASRAPALRSETGRQSVTRTPRTTAPVRVSPSQSASRPSASAPMSAPGSVSRPSASASRSASGSSSAAPRASAPPASAPRASAPPSSSRSASSSAPRANPRTSDDKPRMRQR